MINSKKNRRLLLLVGMILTIAKPVFCQNSNTEVYVIDKTVSSYTGVSYRALHSITLAPGFSFTPTSNNNAIFSASIGFQTPMQDDPNMVINNTVRTDIVKVAGITSEWQINSSNSQTILSYMDGLGRPLQRVTVQGSPLQKDVVQFMSYDQYGQQSKQYLPYVASTNDGSFQTNPQSAQQNFYQTTGNQIATDSYPFAITTYDNSPLGRVLESGAPGADWQPGNHTVKNQFRLNSTADHIMIWNTSGPTNTYYGETQLSVNDLTDENGNHVLTFTNQLGQLVSKKVQADATGTWLETIYIYDDLTNLSYQVSPEGIKRIYAGTANWDASSIATWATAYTYDAQNRLVAKQAPGAAPVYLVYDGNNRLVLMQDGKLRNAYGSTDKWSFIKYDVANRVVISGLYSFVDPGVAGSSNREKLQNYLDGLVYDNISTFAYEVRAAGTTYGYSNQAFPTTLQNADVMAVNYYDDYDFNNNGNPPNQYINPGKPGFNTTAATDLSGFLTGTLKRVIGSNNWIKEAVFYDQFGNAIQKQSNNLINQNGLDITSNAIDIHTRHIIQTIQFKSVSNTSVSNKLTYDLMDRLSQVAIDVNNGGDKVIAKYEYNELGQLKDKKLHQKSNGSFLQTLDYRYNIRGWLMGINNSSLSNADGVNAANDDIFGMTFLYNQADVSGLSNTQYYNGKISAIKWKANDQFSSSSNPVRERGYTYTYDKVDRLIAANYSANSGSGWNAEVNAYNETIGGYDYNGNILSLQRNAQTDDSHAPVQIDNLVYNYINGASNQLASVNDQSGNSVGFNDGANSTNEYTYDANGNLITDANKGETITYNDLNKVASITTSAGTVQYTYDASGTRIRKTVYNPATSSTITYDYLDGFVYTNSALSYFGTVEGRVVAGSSSFTYEYFIKDHLGNVRVSFQDDGNGTAKIVQENEYYAFGMTMQGVISRTAQNTTVNNSLFNGGSELQNDLGFENSYSTFYREYDPVLGRFNSIDPAVDKYAGWSPYNFAFNDPVGLNDPMGDDPPTPNPGSPYDDSWFSSGLSYYSALAHQTILSLNASLNFGQQTTAEISWSLNLSTPNFSSNPMAQFLTEGLLFQMGSNREWKAMEAKQAEAGIDNLSIMLPQVNIQELRKNPFLLMSLEMNAFYSTANQGLRAISILVGGTPMGESAVWAFPDGNPATKYLIPTYPMTVSGTDVSGNSVSYRYEVIRFGVRGEKNGMVSTVGLADAQSYTIHSFKSDYKLHSNDFAENGAWVVHGTYYIHDGPDDRFAGDFGTAGCIEVMGVRGFSTLNDRLLQLSGATSLTQLGASGAITVTYEQATRPPVVLKNK